MNFIVIHWKELKDRKEYLKNTLSDHDTVWIDYYDRRNINDYNIQDIYKKNVKLWFNRIEDVYKDVFSYNNLKDSEICNSLSHIDAIKYISDHLDYGIIIEDDVIFIKDFEKQIEENFKNKPKDYDLIFIGNSYSLEFLDSVGKYAEKSKHIKGNVYDKISHPKTRCVDGYILKKATAIKIINHLKEIVLPFDHELNWVIKDLDLKVYWWDPGVVNQGSKIGKYNSSIR